MLKKLPCPRVARQTIAGPYRFLGAKGFHAVIAEALTSDAEHQTKARVFISYSRQDMA